MSRETAEFAYDLHAGLAAVQIPEFNDLQLIGMAATLAIHIKGLGEIDFEVLRKVSDHLMGIPSMALEKVLEVLDEVEFVTLVTSGRRITKVIPKIPVFDEVYDTIGEFADTQCTLNGHEQATIQILGALQEAPRNRDSLFNDLGIEKPVFDRCVTVGNESGITSEHQARGRNILISPFYFADNLDGLADIAASAGANSIKSVLAKVKANQGWPLSLVNATGEIGGTKLSTTEAALVTKLSEEGVIRPPTIKFGAKSESFVFTPKPGKARLNAANREIYERAMALVSAVRKGQLLPEKIKVRMPVRMLESLRDTGYLRSNTEAADQYNNLVLLRVGQLKIMGGGYAQFHLNRTPENESALGLAIDLLRTGQLANMEVNENARVALSKSDEYIQSLIGASELKKRKKQVNNPEAMHEFEQLLLKID